VTFVVAERFSTLLFFFFFFFVVVVASGGLPLSPLFDAKKDSLCADEVLIIYIILYILLKLHLKTFA